LCGNQGKQGKMLDRSVQLKQRVTENGHPKKRQNSTHNAEVKGSSPSLTTKINALRVLNLVGPFDVYVSPLSLRQKPVFHAPSADP
jgi:hypothetical protein